jgi:polyferredoxin
MIGKKRDLSWPAVAILGAFGLWQTWFFAGISGGGGTALAASVTVTLLYSAMFVMILGSGRPALWRRVFFVTIALMFFPSFMANLVELRGSVTIGEATVINNETPYCHIVTPMVLIPLAFQQGLIFPGRLANHYASVYSMLVIWLVATLTIGRGWCSWVCFYGGWDDGFSRLAKKPRVNLQKAPDWLRYFSFTMLGFVVLASMVSLAAVYCEWLCPFKLVTEFAPITGFASLLATIMFILGFFGLVVVMPILSRRRFQCATFCPFGAMQSLLDRVSIYRIALEPTACSRCMKCVGACPTLSLKEETIRAGKTAPLVTCTKCGECVEACPKGACSYRFRHFKGKPLFAPREAGMGGVDASAGAVAAEPKRLSAVMRLSSWAWSRLRPVLAELLSPRALFVTTAYVFGMVISSGFATGTLRRLFDWLLTGQFVQIAQAAGGGL